MTTGRQLYTGSVSWSVLERQQEVGLLPLDVAQALSFGEAAGLVLCLPTVQGHCDGMPVGFGLLPPHSCAPVVRVGRAIRDRFGEPIPAGAKGMLGAMWREARRPAQVALRLWFRAEPGHGHRPESTPVGLGGAFRIADVYGDVVASVMGLEGRVPQLTGWQIARLDAFPPVSTP